MATQLKLNLDMVATIQNPYQGLKRPTRRASLGLTSDVATIQNPYQGLKRLDWILCNLEYKSQGCNYIESLSGIETKIMRYNQYLMNTSCNYIESLSGIETIVGERKSAFGCSVATIQNPYQGLKPLDENLCPKSKNRCNYIESLSGIETPICRGIFDNFASCNYIESLSGIETTSGNFWERQ